jgi:putative aldouronate transport system permease protein
MSRTKSGQKVRISGAQIAFDSFNILFMLMFMILMFYPMLYVVFASFSNSSRLMAQTGFLIKPVGFSLAAYTSVIRNQMIPAGYLNTLFIVFVGTTINIILTSFGAYYLSRKGQTAGRAVGLFILFTMFFSGGMIPVFLNVDSLGLTNKIWAVIIPNAINTFYLFIMRTAFAGVPDSMEESAKLDGANHLTILFRIYMPLSKAVLAVMILYYGVDHWNSWFNAMLYFRDRSLYPLQLILREILISNDISQMANMAADTEQIAETIKYAVIVVATLPILCLYPFLQKYFVKGVMIGAIKG